VSFVRDDAFLHKDNMSEIHFKSIHTQDAKDLRNLHREIAIMRSLEHPHIVRLHDVFEVICIFCGFVRKPI